MANPRPVANDHIGDLTMIHINLEAMAINGNSIMILEAGKDRHTATVSNTARSYVIQLEKTEFNMLLEEAISQSWIFPINTSNDFKTVAAWSPFVDQYMRL
jgi:hypothetical protein